MTVRFRTRKGTRKQKAETGGARGGARRAAEARRFPGTVSERVAYVDAWLVFFT